MKTACDEVGLTQKLTQPAKGKHLLNLVIPNISSTGATVSLAIANHRLETAELAFKVPEQTTETRTESQIAKADWEMMRDMARQSWEDMLKLNAREAAHLRSKTI